jgi:hypothetical protein
MGENSPNLVTLLKTDYAMENVCALKCFLVVIDIGYYVKYLCTRKVYQYTRAGIFFCG